MDMGGGNETKVHLTTQYKRNKDGKKMTPKRAFNFVVNGLLISTTLVGAVLGGGGLAEASSNQVVASAVTQQALTDSQIMIKNLDLANKALSQAISNGSLNPSFYDSVMKNLLLVDAQLSVEKTFKSDKDLLNAVETTTTILGSKVTTTDKNIEIAKQDSISALNKVRDRLSLREGKNFTSLPKQGLTFSVNTANSSASYASKQSTKAYAVDYKKASSYSDYDASQYWASSMTWAVAKGYIGVYKKAPHPATKKVGNWVNPKGALTEGQMLQLIGKYKYASEYAKTKPAVKGYSYSVAYQVALKHKIPTKATLTSRKAASVGVTRGQMAVALASAHYGKKVSLKDAVAFMYKANITKGNKDKRGNYPKTYDSFGVNTKVSRALGVYLLKNYDTFVKKPVVATPKPKTSTKTIDGIVVKYGGHTYESRNQKEYDAVIKIAQEALKDRDKMVVGEDEFVEKAYGDYIDGVRGNPDRSNPNFRHTYNLALLGAEDTIQPFVDSGLTKSEILIYMKTRSVAANLPAGKDPLTGKPRSAYDRLVLGVTDCDADAQTMSLVLDMAGYNTAVIARPGHAFTVVKINGKWLNATSFREFNMSDYRLNKNGLRVVSEPTHGY